MTQAELELAVAQHTGESLCTIRTRGFSLVEMPDREPLTVDWDEFDATRTALFSGVQKRRRSPFASRLR